LPQLWDLVEDAEVVEQHENTLDGRHRWYRIYFKESKTRQVEELAEKLY